MALAVMALLDWEGRQLDVEMAFLEADVTEDLYVELPTGIVTRRTRLDDCRRPCTA